MNDDISKSSSGEPDVLAPHCTQPSHTTEDNIFPPLPSKFLASEGSDDGDNNTVLEAQLEIIRSEHANLNREHELCLTEKGQILVELEASRAVAIDRKNKLKIAQQEIISQSNKIKLMKEEVNIGNATRQQQHEILIRLESQLDLLKELLLRD